MVYHQTKFGCQGTNSSENIIERVIFWLYEPLTLKMATTTKCPHDSGSWCYITIPNLVTKCSVVQKIPSRQTFTNILNLHCDLDLECSNAIFPWDTPAYDTLLTNQVWLQTINNLEGIVKIVIFWLYNLQATLTLKILNQFFSHDSLPHDNTPPYQGC